MQTAIEVPMVKARIPAGVVRLPADNDFIIGECEMPFQGNRLEACKCISRCSCNCHNVKCSIFMG
jgi:hypothetical protein